VYLYFVIDESSTELLEDLVVIDSFSELVLYLFFINVMLFVFNLIPAFPMDGGRILRSLLSLRMKKIKATRIASVTGQVIAILFSGIGIANGQFSLAFIGVFVFIMARREYRMAKVESRVETAITADVMRAEFTFFYESEPIQKALDAFRQGSEKSFLIFSPMNQVSGVVHEVFLEQGLDRFMPGDPLINLMSSRFEFIRPDLPLPSLFRLMQQNGYSILPVVNEGILVGVVDRRDVMRFINK